MAIFMETIQNPTRADVAKLEGTEPFFTSDEYLVPIVESDPLLRVHHIYYL